MFTLFLFLTCPGYFSSIFLLNIKVTKYRGDYVPEAALYTRKVFNILFGFYNHTRLSKYNTYDRFITTANHVNVSLRQVQERDVFNSRAG